MTTNSVFATLRLNLLALRQRLMLFSSVLIWVSRPSMSDAAKVTFVSSAYILGEPRLKQFGKSLIKIKKRREPIIDPWGASQFKSLPLER